MAGAQWPPAEVIEALATEVNGGSQSNLLLVDKEGVQSPLPEDRKSEAPVDSCQPGLPSANQPAPAAVVASDSETVAVPITGAAAAALATVPQQQPEPQQQQQQRTPAAGVDSSNGTNCNTSSCETGKIEGGRRMPRSFMDSSKSVATTPELTFQGRIIYAGTHEECEKACDLLEPSESFDGPFALGFDIEWRASFQRGVPQPRAATLQLATSEVAVVFHLSRCGTIIPRLTSLLVRPDVLKVGVGAEGDAHKLERDYLMRKVTEGNDGAAVQGIATRIRGVLELNQLANRLLTARPDARPKSSLSDLCVELLGHHVPKPPDIRCGNWEAAPLSEEQLRYAATDAWSGLRCFQEFNVRGRETVAEVAAAIRIDAIPTGPSARKRKAPSGERETVLALDAPAELPPTKRSVYRLFYENGLSADSIAELRGIQVGTVLGYLADAVAAGHAYDMADFDLSLADREAIAAALTASSAEGGRSSLKAVKEVLPSHIDYWAIRIVEAHLARTRLSTKESDTSSATPVSTANS